jgi:hypothetical protein
MGAVSEFDQGSFSVFLFHAAVEYAMRKSLFCEQFTDAVYGFAVIAENQRELVVERTDQPKQQVQFVLIIGTQVFELKL